MCIVVFDALDFDATEQISMDEMVRTILRRLLARPWDSSIAAINNQILIQTIVFLCSTRGFCVLSGVGAVPSDEDLENVTLLAYRELNKSSGQSISKSEFTKWVLRFAGGSVAGTSTMTSNADVSIDSALQRFGILTSPKASPLDNEEVDRASDRKHDNASARQYASEEVPSDEENAQESHPAITAMTEDEQPEEMQEYEQEFAAETPRSAGIERPMHPSALQDQREDGHFEAEATDPDQLSSSGDEPSVFRDDPIESVVPSARDEEARTSAAELVAPDPSLPAVDAPIDFNDFDTYDYTQPEFDGSSGLPPPEEPDDVDSDAENDSASVENE